MGVTTFPCPRCSQQQRQEHENGSEVSPSLCPACLESFLGETTEILEGKGTEKEKDAKLEALRKRYNLKAESARA